MKVDVFIHPDFSKQNYSEEWVSEIVKYVYATHFAKTNWQVSISLDTDEAVRKLNREFRQLDATTDVLSFEGNYLDAETGFNHIGDIIISIPQTIKQAEAAGHSVEEELALLLVHGLLHLDGYDHANPVDKEKMWKIQNQLLSEMQTLIKK